VGAEVTRLVKRPVGAEVTRLVFQRCPLHQTSRRNRRKEASAKFKPRSPRSRYLDPYRPENPRKPVGAEVTRLVFQHCPTKRPVGSDVRRLQPSSSQGLAGLVTSPPTPRKSQKPVGADVRRLVFHPRHLDSC
jgi:hypothetical protein